MTKVVWKFFLTVTNVQDIEMPHATELLTAQTQNSICVIWGIVHPDFHKVKRRIRIYGTGHPMPEQPGKYIATCQDGLGLVWHVFDGGEL